MPCTKSLEADRLALRLQRRSNTRSVMTGTDLEPLTPIRQHYVYIPCSCSNIPDNAIETDTKIKFSQASETVSKLRIEKR